ncbi:MAG: hypothetical protein QNL88_10840 [Acidobacteriota bacterium]|nr:hypothetical protein [Acidobacteriota bacterium]
MINRVFRVGVLLAVLSCQATPQGFLTIAGWSPLDEPATYDSAGLWELINGGADIFLSYGFETVTVQKFSAGDVTVSIAVYDMGRPLNAFGIYRLEASPDAAPLPLGTEAVVSPPYQCLLLKDRYYVKAEAYEGDIDQATGESLVAAIANGLPGEATLPPEFAALPTDGMVAGSSQYSRESLYGLAELDECVHATYTDDAGSEYQVFVVLTTDEVTEDIVWQKLVSRWKEIELGGDPVLFREVPYSGLVGVIRSDSGIIGVANAADKNQLLDRLEQISAR